MVGETKTSLFLCFSFLPLLILSRSHVSRAAETLSPDESLTGKQVLTSKGGNFELGFFQPGPSPQYYLAIWYKRVSKRTAVWVANRETPLSDDESPEVRIADDGNLVILDRSKRAVWSTNSSSPVANSAVVEAELLDSGNLVLRNRSSNFNSSQILWQSFDHPTDTWLPGGWLGLNRVTGEDQLLISWRSSEDPAPGPFSLELDRDGSSQYLIRWNRTISYWTSGLWNPSTQTFDQVPEMRTSYNYNFSFTTTDKGNYFTYDVYDPSIITRFVMDLTGQIKQFTWVENSQQWNVFWSKPDAQCDVYSLCGSFGTCNADGLPPCSCAQGFRPRFPENWNLSDWSGGCARKTPLTCDDGDGFSLLTAVRRPANFQSSSVGSREECESVCRRDCSCSAYSFSNGTSGKLIQVIQALYISISVSQNRILVSPGTAAAEDCL
ncbi:hypothetical protein H6P81_007068 [Aristolochia fimbriata]|uniref:Uncharacterized protein n=1 Tax=Aristolochia fimbriata TaxID=158543 RepID=A0AAV7F0E7_ARIFI|nr:hypothetical protein H6P81_007068 [Aristolochia fimbriata]